MEEAKPESLLSGVMDGTRDFETNWKGFGKARQRA